MIIETKLSYNLDSVGKKRVAQSIIIHSEGNDIFRLPISKARLSIHPRNVSSETLSRKLSQFKKDGVIDLNGQREEL